MKGTTAILIVNGFDRSGVFGPYNAEEARQYPWISLCLRQIERYSDGTDHEILVLDNTGLPEHLTILRSYDRVHVYSTGDGEKAHHDALDFLVAQTTDEVEYLITLDSDAFPVRNGWLSELTSQLEAGAALAGIWRDEMAPVIHPFIHVSCLCIRRSDLLKLRDCGFSFARNMAQDVGQNLTDAILGAGRFLAPLRRSNAWNPHFLLGGLYGDLVYHQGAGSRRAKFWTSSDLEGDERARIALRNAAFGDLDGLVAALRGKLNGVPGPEIRDLFAFCQSGPQGDVSL